MPGFDKGTAKAHVAAILKGFKKKDKKLINSLHEKHLQAEAKEKVTVDKHGFFFPYHGKVKIVFWHTVASNPDQLVGKLVVEILGKDPNFTFKFSQEGIIGEESHKALREFLTEFDFVSKADVADIK